MEINSFRSYIYENSPYNPSEKEKFLPYYYELIGMNEELFELEEEVTERNNNLDSILSELGDLIFYSSRFSRYFNYDLSWFDDYRNGLDQALSELNLLFSVNDCLYQLRKHIAQLNGLTKKSIRKGQVELNIEKVNICLYSIFTNLYRISKCYNINFEDLLDKTIEKFDRRIKKLKEEQLLDISKEDNKQEVKEIVKKSKKIKEI